jgi:hypothetical protein
MKYKGNYTCAVVCLSGTFEQPKYPLGVLGGISTTPYTAQWVQVNYYYVYSQHERVRLDFNMNKYVAM